MDYSIFYKSFIELINHLFSNISENCVRHSHNFPEAKVTFSNYFVKQQMLGVFD